MMCSAPPAGVRCRSQSGERICHSVRICWCDLVLDQLADRVRHDGKLEIGSPRSVGLECGTTALNKVSVTRRRNRLLCCQHFLHRCNIVPTLDLVFPIALPVSPNGITKGEVVVECQQPLAIEHQDYPAALLIRTVVLIGEDRIASEILGYG